MIKQDQTIPCGFMFSRVGTDKLDVNLSGALYVCYDKHDLESYIQMYSSKFYILAGIRSKYVQRIVAKKA